MNVLTIILILIGITIAAVTSYWFLARRPIERAKARAAWLVRELERPSSQIQVVEIWSDEQIERNDRELANTILEQVGSVLCADESVEATRLRAFLGRIRHTDADTELKTLRDFGVAWFACLQVEDSEPESELAKVFKMLNDAWNARREGQLQITDSEQRIALKTIATRLVQSGSPS